MSVLESVRLRLATQLDALDGVFAARDPAFLEMRPASGEWSCAGQKVRSAWLDVDFEGRCPS